MHILTQLEPAQRPSALALGNFDGVHRGHRAVLCQVLDQPNPTVVTFEPHPREYFSGQQGFLLTPGPERLELLAQLGFVQTVVLAFTPALARLPAPEFVQQVLIEQLGATRISIGPDFQFGYQRGGNAQLLRTWGASHGFEVCVATETQWEAGRVSSSAVRAALAQGNLETVHQLLGRNYQLRGPVVRGDGRGRTLGFPTANLAVSPRKFLPCSGVYLVQVTWDDQAQPGLLNLGYRPTFAGQEQRVEVHLLDWQGDLYGKTLTVELLSYLRPESKFTSVAALKQQIQADTCTARQLLIPK
ncbi:bifunctional riboflavin kinase/FAD synthetase [Candidatus Cyanaurora vandensis]|uniref:bifunctional riboflavin kinase/FAD synthetase n=1 Tax=Candidatus Cyanaurora vandensis TaxID=2714958 RepID=UPI0025797FCB|nr:bifunctional riboflavin kinase/FAD synthetase [Candidatus Cyanaurora vandensis]